MILQSRLPRIRLQISSVEQGEPPILPATVVKFVVATDPAAVFRRDFEKCEPFSEVY
jgi:hypothetical protein